jgi:hypothetical protein
LLTLRSLREGESKLEEAQAHRSRRSPGL